MGFRPLRPYVLHTYGQRKRRKILHHDLFRGGNKRTRQRAKLHRCESVGVICGSFLWHGRYCPYRRREETCAGFLFVYAIILVWCVGGAVTQRSAKPRRPVQLWYAPPFLKVGRVAELVYAADLKSASFTGLWVRVPSRPPFLFPFLVNLSTS